MCSINRQYEREKPAEKTKDKEEEVLQQWFNLCLSVNQLCYGAGLLASLSSSEKS